MLSKSGRKPSMRACSYFSFELLPRCFIARPLFGGSRTHLNRCPSAQVNPRMWPFGDQINTFIRRLRCLIGEPLRQFVRERAGHRCEYCGMPQEAEPFFTYHVEHIVARRHGGGDNSENLAFACYHCNLHKGPNLSGIDQESGALVRLFNPREDTMPSDPRFRSVRRLDYDGEGT